MTEPAYQQTPYPLILALSVALFLHVVLATLVSGWLSLPDPDRPEPTVRVRIAMPGAQPGASPVETVPETSRAESGTPPNAGEETGEADSSPSPAAASTLGDTKRAPEETGTVSDPSPESRTPKETPSQSEQAPAQPETARSPGTDSPVTGTETDTPVTRLSREDARQRSDYEITLWEKIAQQVEYTPLMAELEEPGEVVLDLRLMANGALRRARIETSSGIEGLDAIAREAALAATPFPKPPEGRRRFSVRLIFEPGAR